MRKSPYYRPKAYRNGYHLSLKDVAYILDMDEGNLSRFEAGKSPNSKALLGYHLLFNLSIDVPIRQVFSHSNEDLLHRCFKLLDILESRPKTIKITKRREGINRIINHLSESEGEEVYA